MFTKLSEIEVPEQMLMGYSTGCSLLDRLLSSEAEGIVPSQVILFAGGSGLGKTTASMKIAEGLIQNNENYTVVFVSLEMSDFQLKVMSRRIPGVSSMMITRNDNIDQILAGCKAIEANLVVIDSWQYLLSSYQTQQNTRDDEKDSAALAKKINAFAKENFTSFIFIGHARKDGTYKGGTGVKHEIDAHFDIVKIRQTGDVLIQSEKNRMGNTNITLQVRWSDTGEMYFVEYEDGQNSGPVAKLSTGKAIVVHYEEGSVEFASMNEAMEKLQMTRPTLKARLAKGTLSDGTPIEYKKDTPEPVMAQVAEDIYEDDDDQE